MDDPQGDPLPPSKRPRVDSSCIVHSTAEDHAAPLVKLKDSDSWQTLLHAAKIRNHEQLLQVAKNLKDNEIPNISYHAKCRKLFTMKKQLEAIQRKELQAEKSVESSTPRRSICQQPSTSRVYEEKCILCEKQSKYIAGSNTREALQKCVTIEADAKLREAAISKLDDRVVALLSREAVAAEVHFHRSCYRTYTKTDSSGTNHPPTCTSTDSEYYILEDKAFQHVCHYVRSNLFVNPHPMMFNDLRTMLVDYMTRQGCKYIKDSTKKNFRRKLEDEFQDSVNIISDEKGWLVIYPNTITKDKLVLQNLKLQKELDNLRANEKDKLASVTKAALLLRADILTHNYMETWPPNLEEYKNVDAFLPNSVVHFYHTAITGTVGDKISMSVERQIKSYSQDLIHAVTRGRKHPPKHVLLPFAVKSLTGNAELVQVLNRLGHCVSYSVAEEIETALCLQKLESVSPQSVALPANIHPHLFTTLAWDNIDRIEETLSGGGTSHRVNGIAIQPKLIGPLPPKETHCLEKSRKRSIDIIPEVLPSYNSGKRLGPPNTITRDPVSLTATEGSKRKNRLWAVSRTVTVNVPSWTGFNIKSRESVEVSSDEIGYLPMIHAPATSMSTVYEILKQSITIMKALQQPYIVCVFDQALYAKAVEISWKHPEMFKNLVLRMGDFHTVYNFMATIGKRFQDAGLKDLAVESGVIAEGSAFAVMEGCLYNRALRFHKLMYEALLQLAWKAFPHWLEDHHPMKKNLLHQALVLMEAQNEEINENSIKILLEHGTWLEILNLFELFLGQLRQGVNGDLASFWMSYIDMVDIILGLIRAAREGDWDLHLQSVRAMIPWVFAYDKLNYARYLPFYYATMTSLEESHPGISSEFQKGRFSVQLGAKNPFGKIPVDQAIEETVNRDTQVAGGTKGFSLKPAAVTKYYLSAEFRSIALQQVRFMVQHQQAKSLHADLHITRIKKDYQAVEAIIGTLEKGWINPLDGDIIDLTCLSTGCLATKEVAKDLLGAQSAGEKAYQQFKQERLESSNTETKFHDRMTKMKLKTFSSMLKKKTITKGKGKDIILHADRDLFGRMILGAQSRKLEIKDVLSHPLGPIPWSLATADGSLRKTNKCGLANYLLKNISPSDTIPSPSACIIDGMSLVQKVKGEHKTFKQLAEHLLKSALLTGASSHRIDVVFDVYNTLSIKNAERNRRGSEESIKVKNITGGQTIHQWRKFLCCAENKTSLVEYLVKEWRSPSLRNKLIDKELYVTCKAECYHITGESSETAHDLHCSQEEADTRVLLHAKHAADKGIKAVIITADDTDILVLALAFKDDIRCSVFQQRGTQACHHYIDIGKVVLQHGADMCTALIGLHSFTGCDTTSAFAGKGKVKPLKVLQKCPDFLPCMSNLGKTWELSENQFKALEAFVCRMYLPNQPNCCSVNECRYLMFCTQKGEGDSSQLPPCHDTLYQHSLRANYQAAIWRSSLQQEIEIPDPSGFGWVQEDDNTLGVKWMTGLPAPQVVLDLLNCDCRRACIVPHCTCISNGLKCTLMCRLQNCENKPEDDVEYGADFNDDTDDDSEGEEN